MAWIKYFDVQIYVDRPSHTSIKCNLQICARAMDVWNKISEWLFRKNVFAYLKLCALSCEMFYRVRNFRKLLYFSMLFVVVVVVIVLLSILLLLLSCCQSCCCCCYCLVVNLAVVVVIVLLSILLFCCCCCCFVVVCVFC